MLNYILNSRAKTITFAAFLLAFSALISRILGLIRDRLLAGRFGAGETLDIYFAAFRIPDFVYGILIAGGILAAFLPVFSEYWRDGRTSSKEAGWPIEVLKFTNNVLNCFLVLLIFICGILALLAPQISDLIFPGFSAESKTLTANLTRIMFLSPIFFGLSNIFSGILQYFHRFLIYSLAPILYNLGIIFGILVLVPIFGVYGLAYGVIFGAFLHLVIQIPAARVVGYQYRPIFNFGYPGLKKIFRLMVPRVIGAAAFHINLIVITAIASTLISGSIAIFNFSNNLQYFAIGLIGVSFAISSFPALSRSWANRQKEKFLERFSAVFRQIVFLITPVSILMFLLRAQIVRLILGTGRFGWLETRLTSASLGLFCLGIFAASLIPLVTKAFFALQETKTPVIIAIISMATNVILSLLFIYFLKFPNIFRNLMISFLKLQGIENIEVIALPLALSFSATVQFSLLIYFLYKKVGNFKIKEILKSLKKVQLATFFTGIFVYLTLYLAANFVNMRTFWGVLIQTVLASGAGISVYILITYFLKSPELRVIKYSILKQFRVSP